MTAAEARELTNAAKFPGVDSPAQLAAIMTAVESEATKGGDRVKVSDLTDDNKKQLIADGYFTSLNATTGTTTISW